ncbi:MAG TPA: RNA methyltransferase substrate-binding domain-containing protein, partial [Chitinophaga sp.]|nr:RNA methyltransferase substrate-binding domain-containing protein [Chitinophaga sp.]
MEQRRSKPGGFRQHSTRQHAPKPKASSMVIGRQPVVEAINAGKAIERIYLLRNASGDIIPQIRQLAAQYNIPIN